MAEFSEVMKQYIRMCRLSSCDECVLNGDGRSCSVLAHGNPEEFERRVMEWAKEHPEPKFPRWSDYLNEMGYGLYYRIPAEIAEKLGIEPKEPE